MAYQLPSLCRGECNLREEHGSIVVVYATRTPIAWHMRLVEPSVPKSADIDGSDTACPSCQKFRAEKLKNTK